MVQQPVQAETTEAISEPSQVRTLGVAVTVAKAQAKRLAKNFSVLTSVKPSTEVTVLAETSGRILQMPAKEGQFVQEGSVLAVLDQESRAAVHEAALATLKKAQGDLTRAQGFYKDNLIPLTEWEQAQLALVSSRTQEVASRKELEAATVRSPINGRIAETYVVRGGQLAPGTQVALIIDPSVLKGRVMLPEVTALRLKVGDQVAIEAAVFPGKTYSARVTQVGIRGEATNAFAVEFTLDPAAVKDFHVGMSIQASFQHVASRETLTIPRSAILGSTKDAEVFRVVGDKAVRTRIETGAESGTEIEVLSGLTSQDLLVVSGQNLLADGQLVRVTQ